METYDTIDTTPFKRLVLNLGAVPTDFTDGMAYYEILAWLCKYLETVIIPHINQNTENYNKLISEFETLKKYVEEYLQGLDDLNQKVDRIEGEIYNTINAKYIQAITEATRLVDAGIALYEGKLQLLSDSVDERFANWSEELIVNNPVTGEDSTVQDAINSVYDVTRVYALTAKEYDDLELTAQGYDNYELTALAYDTLGKNLLA